LKFKTTTLIINHLLNDGCVKTIINLYIVVTLSTRIRTGQQSEQRHSLVLSKDQYV